MERLEFVECGKMSSEKNDVEGHDRAGYGDGNVKTGPDDRKFVEYTREAFLLRQEHRFETGNST